jgi:hypothetical protein
MAHGRGAVDTAVSIALAATEALEVVSHEQQMLYLALIQSALGDVARKAFEMNAQAGKLISRWHTDSFEKGEAMGIAKTIISMLEARRLTVTESQRQRVLDCTDVTQLNRWVDRSVTITDVAALFDA